MAKVLLVNPNKWGRGITSIWIASHSAKLKKAGHSVDLFDCTFFKSWTVDETSYNTKNLQYKETDYSNYISYSEEDIVKSLQIKIDSFEPDIIFWSALGGILGAKSYYILENLDDLLSSSDPFGIIFSFSIASAAAISISNQILYLL